MFLSSFYAISPNITTIAIEWFFGSVSYEYMVLIFVGLQAGYETLSYRIEKFTVEISWQLAGTNLLALNWFIN